MTFTTGSRGPDRDAEARHWFLRLHGSEPTAEEIGECEAWLRQGGNAQAYDRVAAVWSLAERPDGIEPSLAEVARDPYGATMSVRAWRRRIVTFRALSLAACACVTVLGGGWM